jgi:hypothetical protein
VRTGTSGNDFFEDKSNTSTWFQGGTGRDTVVFAGSQAGYTIVRQADGSVKVTNGASVDTLVSIERLQFDDGTLAFDLGDNAGQVTAAPAPATRVPATTAA